MPRRPGDGLSGRLRGAWLAKAALASLTCAAVGLTACQTDVGDAGCSLLTNIVLPASSLTLLHDARLDRVGDGFVLMGSDGAIVRWATLTNVGVLGPEQALSLPSGATSPRFAVAGMAAPADRLLVGYLTAAANGTDAELRMLSVAVDGTSASEPGAALVSFPGGATTAPMLEMRSSRVGMNAGLAWYDSQQSAIRFVTLDGAGQMTRTPTLSEQASAFSCLGFSDGAQPLTYTYNRVANASPSPPQTVITEAQEDGGLVNTVQLSVADTEQGLTCSVVAPTVKGYGTAWQDEAGSWLAVAERRMDDSTRFNVKTYPFASATDFGGPDLQPPLRGLVQLGSDFGVLLAKPHAAELWRLDGNGNRLPGALVLPSLMGNLGEISAVRAEGGGAGVTMAVTYADYTDSNGSTGRRMFVTATCR
jgi:hypothetical protein